MKMVPVDIERGMLIQRGKAGKVRKYEKKPPVTVSGGLDMFKGLSGWNLQYHRRYLLLRQQNIDIVECFKKTV